MNKLYEKGFGIAGAAIFGFYIFIVGVLGILGFFTEQAQAMATWHVFFSLTPLGILFGIIEAAIVGFVFTFLFAWVYNRLSHV